MFKRAKKRVVEFVRDLIHKTPDRPTYLLEPGDHIFISNDVGLQYHARYDIKWSICSDGHQLKFMDYAQIDTTRVYIVEEVDDMSLGMRSVWLRFTDKNDCFQLILCSYTPAIERFLFTCIFQRVEDVMGT